MNSVFRMLKSQKYSFQLQMIVFQKMLYSYLYLFKLNNVELLKKLNKHFNLKFKIIKKYKIAIKYVYFIILCSKVPTEYQITLNQ